MVRAGQYVIVVRRDEPELFQRLSVLAAGGDAQVILDRRRRDRRVVIQDVAADRRRRERRAPLDPAGDARGFVVARAYRVPRAEGARNGHRNCLELPPALALTY